VLGQVASRDGVLCEEGRSGWLFEEIGRPRKGGDVEVAAMRRFPAMIALVASCMDDVLQRCCCSQPKRKAFCSLP
jgi:hypothetical protein